jgi:hypothetical protein
MRVSAASQVASAPEDPFLVVVTDERVGTALSPALVLDDPQLGREPPSTCGDELAEPAAGAERLAYRPMSPWRGSSSWRIPIAAVAERTEQGVVGDRGRSS